MTPRKRARVPSTGSPARAGGATPTPCRHRTMTANDDTPDWGHESTGPVIDDPPMQDASNREVALAVEEAKNRVRESTEDVTRALLNDSVPLTGEMVSSLWDSASRLEALSRTLVHRVPDEHRIED